MEETRIGIRLRPVACPWLVDVERQRLVLQEQEDERGCEHYAEQTGAAKADERAAEWCASALLDEAHDRIDCRSAEHQGRGFGHSDVEVAGDRDAQPENGQQSLGAQHQLDEQEEKGQEDVRSAERVVAVQERPTAEGKRSASDNCRNDGESENASIHERRRSAEHERPDHRNVPRQRGRVQVDREEKGIEDLADHVPCQGRSSSLIGIPKRYLAIGVRTACDLGPWLRLPG